MPGGVLRGEENQSPGKLPDGKRVTVSLLPNSEIPQNVVRGRVKQSHKTSVKYVPGENVPQKENGQGSGIHSSLVGVEIGRSPSKEPVGGIPGPSNLKRKTSDMNVAKARKDTNAAQKTKVTMNLQDMPLFRLHTEKSTKIKESKSARRFARKQSKMMNLIADQLNTERSSEPTKWVVVWGAGLAFRHKKSVVFSFFDPLPKEVRFYAEKAYCTIRFATKEDAEKAKNDKTGIEFESLQPLLVGYLGEEPPPEDIDISAFKHSWPRGLGLLYEFVSDEEQEQIVRELLPAILEGGTGLKNRFVKHYGYEFRYSTNDINIDEPLGNGIPECLTKIVDRMVEEKILPRRPEQLTLNHYTAGQGIPPHVDTHSAFEAPIVSISLNSSATIDFRDSNNQVSVLLPARSLLVMDDESRYQWTHGIATRTFDLVPDQIYGGATIIERHDRISLTFRLIRISRECDCNFPDLCDTQQTKLSAENAARIESELVHKVYEHIAEHFHITRHSPWPKVKDFIESIAPGRCLLDVGCGNGKYFNLTDYIYEVGTDMSVELLNIAQANKTAEGIRAHCMRLPFIDNCFDATICIAVLHHLATKERRLEALMEIIRVTSPGGEGLIYVWAKGQRMQEVNSAYIRQRELKKSYYEDAKTQCMVPLRNYEFIPVHQPGQDFTHNDMLVPWVTQKNGKSELHHRFYHVFARGELDDLLKQLVPPPQILDSYYDQGNWCVRFRKEVSSNQNPIRTANPD